MNFPLYLPKPQQTYSASQDPALASNRFEVGFRQRRRFSETEERISVQWNMDQLQFDIFRSFVKFELENGALPFLVDIIGLDGIESREVRLEGGRFSERYAAHQRYVISATLVCVSAVVFPLGIYEFMISLQTDDISEFMETSDILNLYIDSVFGESSANEETAAFLLKYS